MRIIFLVVAAFVFSSSLLAQHGHDNHRGGHGRASVSIIASLPFGAAAVSLGNEHYHYYHGTFYQPVQQGYAIVPAPMGILVPTLPPGSVSVIIGARNYFRFGGVFYLPLESQGYQTVLPPAGSDSAAPQAAKDTYEKMEIEGKTYYKKGSKIYKASVSDKGEVVYEEVGKASKG